MQLKCETFALIIIIITYDVQIQYQSSWQHYGHCSQVVPHWHRQSCITKWIRNTRSRDKMSLYHNDLQIKKNVFMTNLCCGWWSPSPPPPHMTDCMSFILRDKQMKTREKTQNAIQTNVVRVSVVVWCIVVPTVRACWSSFHRSYERCATEKRKEKKLFVLLHIIFGVDDVMRVCVCFAAETTNDRRASKNRKILETIMRCEQILAFYLLNRWW